MSALCYSVQSRADTTLPADPSSPPSRKLLDQVRDKIRLKHYSYRTEESYVQWIRRYILFYNKRHPNEMGAPEIEAFLTHLAGAGQVAAANRQTSAPARPQSRLWFGLLALCPRT